VDIALTVNIHPYLLGVEPEAKGCVSVPEGTLVQVKEAHSAWFARLTRMARLFRLP
jgi:hypothetical protein